MFLHCSWQLREQQLEGNFTFQMAQLERGACFGVRVGQYHLKRREPEGTKRLEVGTDGLLRELVFDFWGYLRPATSLFTVGFVCWDR